jgi:hypothetical protein
MNLTIASESASEIFKSGKSVKWNAMAMALTLIGPQLLVNVNALASEWPR